MEVNCETDFVARTDEFKSLVRNIAMQVAAANPIAVRREDIDPAVVEKELEIYRAQAKDEGKPVAMLPVRLEDGATICMPNTVAVIHGTRRVEHAQKLADYLLSEECELALAGSKARQVPLGPVDESKLSDEVRLLRSWVADGVPLAGLGAARAACLGWLKGLYVQ